MERYTILELWHGERWWWTMEDGKPISFIKESASDCSQAVQPGAQQEKRMKVYEVYFDEEKQSYYVRGLKADYGAGDQHLLHHIPYPQSETPEVEDPENADAMHAALYDMYQWHDGLKEGDRFTTPFGNFKCVSFHVVKDTGAHG